MKISLQNFYYKISLSFQETEFSSSLSVSRVAPYTDQIKTVKIKVFFIFYNNLIYAIKNKGAKNIKDFIILLQVFNKINLNPIFKHLFKNYYPPKIYMHFIVKNA